MTREQFFRFGRVLLVIAMAVTDKGVIVKHTNLSLIKKLREDLFDMEGD